jgi:hypothetical protein
VAWYQKQEGGRRNVEMEEREIKGEKAGRNKRRMKYSFIMHPYSYVGRAVRYGDLGRGGYGLKFFHHLPFSYVHNISITQPIIRHSLMLLYINRISAIPHIFTYVYIYL